jgi:hypothetical protein
VNPIISSRNPVFSWAFSDPDARDTQGAYRILVASSPANLAADNGDIWDSGKVPSSAQSVTYAGPELTSGLTYYWKVKTWDNHGIEGPYCEVQTFTTDFIPPTSSIITPVDKAILNSLMEISGIASDPSGIQRVEVLIQRLSDGKYWDGSSWRFGEAWLLATSTTSWTYDSSGVSWSDGDYKIRSKAIDNAGNVEIPSAGNTFTYYTTGPSAPNIWSITHPNQETTYANNDPIIHWCVRGPSPSGIAGYSYILDQNPNTIPDTVSEGIGTARSYTNLVDGTWWFHVRALDNAGNWGSASHFKLMINAATGVGVKATKVEDVTGVQVDYVVDASSEADTMVILDTLGDVEVVVLKYAENPHPTATMPEGVISKFVDVSVSDPSMVSWPIYVKITYTNEEVMGLNEDGLGIYYWRNGTWHRCSNTGVDIANNYVWAYMTREEASGSPLTVGGSRQLPSSHPSYPVGGAFTSANKLVILAPYLTLIGLTMIATIALKKKH